ncbi:hypothetical protein KPH14_003765 [Odynerus spinipes]|uniref:Uncharacterized protein n=1 Tax=Odynerus spinipes TaxID=1348599 RepID=A0AAD9VVH1_9HYME|nr:hypothetical protein KPH14_003765 [Odynerus spinipes]
MRPGNRVHLVVLWKRLKSLTLQPKVIVIEKRVRKEADTVLNAVAMNNKLKINFVIVICETVFNESVVSVQSMSYDVTGGLQEDPNSSGIKHTGQYVQENETPVKGLNANPPHGRRPSFPYNYSISSCNYGSRRWAVGEQEPDMEREKGR